MIKWKDVKCKKCGQKIRVSYFHWQTGIDKIKCPTCNYEFIVVVEGEKGKDIFWDAGQKEG